MQRKLFEDPVVLFASPPDLNDVCSVTVRVESKTTVAGSVTTQPKILKCRELIFTEPDIIAAPSYEQYDCFTVVMTQTLYRTGRLQARMKKNGLQPEKPMRLNPGLYQACLRYTLLARLAPAWNKVGDWLIQGRDFLSHTGCANAVKCEVMVQTGQLYMSVCASVLRLSPLQLVDLNLSQLEMQSLLHNAERGNGELALHNAWCHVVPSMKKARLCTISLSVPESSPFNSYRDIKRHWKNTYGFRLPETDDDIFYGQISFCGMGGKQFTYPNICLRCQPLQCVPRVDPKPTLTAFLQDVHGKLPAACGHALRFHPQLRYPRPAVYPASQDVQGPGANLSKRSSSSSQLPLRNPREIVQMRVASSQPPASHLSALKASAQFRPPGDDHRAAQTCRSTAQPQPVASGGVGPLSQPLSQSRVTPSPAGLTATPKWSQIARPSSASSQGIHPVPRVSGEKRFENRVPATQVASTASFDAARAGGFAGGSAKPLSTPVRTKGPTAQRGSLSLHKPGRQLITPFSGERNSSQEPPSPSLTGGNPATRESSPNHQFQGTTFSQAFTSQTFRSESQEPVLSASQITVPTQAAQILQEPRGGAAEKTSLKSGPTYVAACHDFKTDVFQSAPASATGKVVPIFRPKPGSNTKNKTNAEEARGTGLSQDTGTRVVPVFRPKKKSAAAPSSSQPSGLGQNRASASASRKHVSSLVSCSQVTSTTNLGLLAPTQRPCSKPPVFSTRHHHTAAKNVQSGGRVVASPSPGYLDNQSPHSVAAKLKKKMLQSSGTTTVRTTSSTTHVPSGTKAAEGSANLGGGPQTLPTATSPGSVFSQPLTLTPGMNLTSTPTGALGSQRKRKGESEWQSQEGAEGGGEKKARSKPQVQALDVESLARADQLQKVNTVTLISWLKERGVHCKAKDKKGDLMHRVKVFLALTTSEP